MCWRTTVSHANAGREGVFFECLRYPHIRSLHHSGRELNPAVNLYYAPLDIQTRELRAIPTEIAGYQRCPGRHIDYVLLWGVRDRDRDKAIPRLIFKQLHEAYELIYTSPQRGLKQLYGRRGLNIEP